MTDQNRPKSLQNDYITLQTQEFIKFLDAVFSNMTPQMPSPNLEPGLIIQFKHC